MKRGLLPPREKKDRAFVQKSKPPDISNFDVNVILKLTYKKQRLKEKNDVGWSKLLFKVNIITFM